MPLSTRFAPLALAVVQLTICCCARGQAAAPADEGQTTPAVSKPAAAAELREPDLVIRDGRFAGPDGERLLSWSFGLTRIEDLPAYRACGFDTVYLDLAGSIDPPGARDLVRDAVGRGMSVIIGLNAVEAVAGGQPFAPSDPAAAQASVHWLQQAVQAWRGEPGLIAWGLQHDLEERCTWPEAAFGPWLYDQYRDTVNVASAWGAELDQDVPLTPDLALSLDAQRPGRMGRATLDIARWQAMVLRGMQRSWVAAIHAVDPARPVLGGRMARGRSLLNAPPELSGLQPARGPLLAGALVPADPYELVALASQTQRFAAICCLEAEATPAQLGALAWRAAAGGAAGLSFGPWPVLAADTARRQAVAAALGGLHAAGAVSFRPRGSAAVVLSPWAAGPQLYGAGWYGYSPLGGSEPGGLLEMVRRGSRYGTVDVLTDRDLASFSAASGATPPRVDLSRYGAIFVPAGWLMEGEQLSALARYVDGGGVVVGDLGLGSEGLRGAQVSLTRPFAEWAGLVPAGLFDVTQVALPKALRERLANSLPGDDPLAAYPPGAPLPGSLVVAAAHELLPALKPLDQVGRRAARAQLTGPAQFVVPLGGTKLIARQAELGARDPSKSPTAGWFVRQHGTGALVYASGLLWADFGPDDPLFAPLHEPLLGRRATASVVDDVAPGATWLATGEDQLWLDRRTRADGLVSVELPTNQGLVLGDGLNYLRRVQSGTGAARQALINRYVTWMAAGETRYRRPLPLALWPMGPAVGAEVTAYGPDGIELWLYGAGDGLSADGALVNVDNPVSSDLLLTLHDGAYRLVPGSQHRIQLTSFPHRPAEMLRVTTSGTAPATQTAMSGISTIWRTVDTDPDGRITLQGSAQVTRVRIRPAGAAWEE